MTCLCNGEIPLKNNLFEEKEKHLHEHWLTHLKTLKDIIYQPKYKNILCCSTLKLPFEFSIALSKDQSTVRGKASIESWKVTTIFGKGILTKKCFLGLCPKQRTSTTHPSQGFFDFLPKLIYFNYYFNLHILCKLLTHTV